MRIILSIKLFVNNRGKEKKEIENDEARKAESWKIQRYALF